MSFAKKNRLEQAKLAKAYMAGGSPPYQAARACGFMRVGLMEEAIRELDEQEKLENAPDVETAHAEPNPTKTDKEPVYKPLQVWKNDLASVAFYGHNDGRKPMYRLRLEGVQQYLVIPETHIKDAAKLLCEAADMKGPESSDNGNSELAELCESLKRENDDLCKRNDDLRNRIDELTHRQKDDELAKVMADLEAERAAHNELKLKMFDKLLALI